MWQEKKLHLLANICVGATGLEIWWERIYSNSLSAPWCQHCFLHFINHGSVRLPVCFCMHSMKIFNEECMCLRVNSVCEDILAAHCLDSCNHNFCYLYIKGKSFTNVLLKFNWPVKQPIHVLGEFFVQWSPWKSCFMCDSLILFPIYLSLLLTVHVLEYCLNPTCLTLLFSQM